MKYLIDLHTHTIVSGHAYTTLLENIKQASEVGIKIMGTSEHGPKMPGAPHIWYFGNMDKIPREVYGVTVLKGCEANILNINGELDIPEIIQNKLDYIIASLHDVCIEPGDKEYNTTAVLNAMDNPNIDILGHLGNPVYPIDIDAIVDKAKEKNILIEINNGSLSGSREGSYDNCIKIAQACKEKGVRVILGTDSHISFTIGNFDKVKELVDSAKMPEELIMNTNEKKIVEYLKGKGKLENFNLE
ncbi:phosphatase [Clostridium felsineum]|uniref:Phosphatase YcdX n=1 Tax=Clostridium felsineum TaxID=36839 RepID=A0A1S8L8M1_9CLOT|nr:phosphatase [Clostridium felsineum]MCR3760536.1 phosphatase [Clostridium felsineum]URZ02105.1 putative phosphatase YcdX [Clostridium felsineum]URZ05125.1 putative phosphatase YcdX [Clostridium felsineum]URZ10166.1 putative phosphatase YcdX [Clostridium felsineum]URZ17938.1 putative phosphatase YcdX [Clostridium felsineum DSM 794]